MPPASRDVAGPPAAVARAREALRFYGPGLLPWLSPRRKLVILNVARSGSELLVDLLRCHSRVECHGEILSEPVRSPWLYVQAHAVRAGSRADAFGFKLIAQQLTDVQRLDPRAFLGRLSAAGYLIVILTRRNLLRMCLSWARTRAGAPYHLRSPLEDRRPVRIEPEEAIANMVLNEELMARMRNWAEGLPQLSLVYEDDLALAGSHQATADRVFAALELPSESVRPHLVKLAAPDLRADVENYEELAGFLRRTRFAPLLEEPG